MNSPHNKSFHMRLTEKEYETLHSNAAKAGLPLSTYMRFMMKGMRPKDKLQPDWYKYHRQLLGIGNNLNQLVHLAHRDRHINEEAFRTFREDFTEAYSALFRDMISPEHMDRTKIIQDAREEASKISE